MYEPYNYCTLSWLSILVTRVHVYVLLFWSHSLHSHPLLCYVRIAFLCCVSFGCQHFYLFAINFFTIIYTMGFPSSTQTVTAFDALLRCWWCCCCCRRCCCHCHYHRRCLFTIHSLSMLPLFVWLPSNIDSCCSLAFELAYALGLFIIVAAAAFQCCTLTGLGSFCIRNKLWTIDSVTALVSERKSSRIQQPNKQFLFFCRTLSCATKHPFAMQNEVLFYSIRMTLLCSFRWLFHPKRV